MGRGFRASSRVAVLCGLYSTVLSPFSGLSMSPISKPSISLVGTYLGGSVPYGSRRTQQRRSSRQPVRVSQVPWICHCNVVTYRDETVILQNCSFAIAQALRYLPPFFAIQHHTAEVRIYSMTFVESQAVLSYHIELTTEHRPGFAIDTDMH